jgi:hypothetical protein
MHNVEQGAAMANGARGGGMSPGSLCRECRDESAETRAHSRSGGGNSAALLAGVHDGALGEAGSRDLRYPHLRRLHSLDSLLAAAQESPLVVNFHVRLVLVGLRDSGNLNLSALDD